MTTDGTTDGTTTRTAGQHGRADVVWRLLPLALAALATVAVLTLPLARETTVSAPAPGGGGVTASTRAVTLLQQEGWRALPALVVPLLVTAVAAALPRRARWPACTTAAVLLTGWIVLGAASVGLFYLPAAAAQTAAAIYARRR